MRHVSTAALMVAFVMLLAPVTGCAEGAPAPEEMTGLKIGEKAPDFTLPDQNGEERSLGDLLDQKGTLAIMFYRSATW